MFTEDNNLFYKILSGLILVSMVIIFAAVRILEKYMILPQLSIDSWADLSNYIMVSMSVTGIISVLEWHVIFPDKKDAVNLKPLPVKFLNLYTAKFLSIVSFVGVLSIVISLVPSFMFSVFVQYQSPTVHVILPLFLCFFLANLSVFFLVSILNGIIHLLFREHIRQLAGFFVQLIFVVIFVSSLILSHGINQYLLQSKETGSYSLLYFPQLWYTGLFQQYAGNSDPLFEVLGKFGSFSIVFLTITYLTLLYVSFRNGRNDKPGKKANAGRRYIGEMFRRIFIRSAESQASFMFLKSTFFRKFEVWIGIASFLGLGIGIVLISMIIDLNAGKDIFQIGGDIFAMTTVCYSMILGAHFVIKTRVETNANWLIRVSESLNKRGYGIGIRMFVFTYLLIPLVAFTTLVRAYFFGIETTVYFLLFTLAFIIFLYEIFFFRLDVFPFASGVAPFSGTRVSFWLMKLIGIAVVPGLAVFVWRLLASHLFHVLSLYILGFAWLLLKKNRSGMDYPFRFDPEASDYFLSLDLPDKIEDSAGK